MIRKKKNEAILISTNELFSDVEFGIFLINFHF